MEKHILKSLDTKFELLLKQLVGMAEKVEKQFESAIASLEEASDTMAERTIEKDNKINKLDADLNDLCFSVIALYQPVASDLRIPFSVIKMSSDLERIGDEIEKLARATLVTKQETYAAKRPLLKMAKKVLVVFQQTIHALDTADTDQAQDILNRGKNLSHRYDRALEEVIVFLNEEGSNQQQKLAYLWAIKGIDRVLDHIYNLCQQLIFMQTGRHVPGKPGIE